MLRRWFGRRAGALRLTDAQCEAARAARRATDLMELLRAARLAEERT